MNRRTRAGGARMDELRDDTDRAREEARGVRDRTKASAAPPLAFGVASARGGCLLSLDKDNGGDATVMLERLASRRCSSTVH